VLRARKWRRRVLAAGLLCLASSRPAAADRVRFLAADREAAEARVELVLAAREELLVSAFIFGDDPFTLTSLALLRDAARRGLRTRVLVDAQWNKIPRAVQAHLLEEGVELREFHPFRFDRLSWILRRMHDKLIVADGRHLLAGGRNVESPYFGLGRQVRRRNYLDLDLLVAGDAATAARQYFHLLWSSRHVSEVGARASVAERRQAAARLDRHQSWLEARIAEAWANCDREPPLLTEVGPIRFLHDPIGRRRRTGAVGPGLRDLLGAARRSVVVESPYLIPSRSLRASLRAALDRGVKIRILTNSLATTDNLLAQSGYVGHRRELVRSGVELWEYSGPECLHTKAAVIDGETVIVGSYNLDPRSERWNSEVALVARDRTLAATLAASFDRHLERAWRIDSRGYPEGSETPFPGVSRSKVRKLRLLRLFTPFIRGQL